jgi:hypothetical protein
MRVAVALFCWCGCECSAGCEEMRVWECLLSYGGVVKDSVMAWACRRRRRRRRRRHPPHRWRCCGSV